MEKTPWKQVNFDCPGPDLEGREQQAVTHLARVFPQAEADGLVRSWFFIRKDRWRIRYLLAEELSNPGADPVHPLLTDGVTWVRDIYEPEVHAFGGPESMDTAHTLFHGDSHYLLAFLGRGGAERRERSLLLCTALMRAAGLDINEQGDVWARVADMRARLLDVLPDQQTWLPFIEDVRQLLHGTVRSNEIDGGWLDTFERAGRALKTIREEGSLKRGIRAVIALHVIFHWNRIGIAGRAQALLALAAKDAVFSNPVGACRPRP